MHHNNKSPPPLPPPPTTATNNYLQQQQQQQVFPPLNYSRSYFTQWLLQSAAAAEVAAAAAAASSGSSKDNKECSGPKEGCSRRIVLPPGGGPPPPRSNSVININPFYNRNSSSGSSSSEHYHNHHQSSKSSKSSSSANNNRMELIQLLAINALEFTAPVYSFLNRETMTNNSAVAASVVPLAATTTTPKTAAAATTTTTTTTANNVAGGGGSPPVMMKHNHHHQQQQQQQHVPAVRTNSSNSLTLTHHSNSELKLEREIIQLSGHPGSFAPAGPNSIWKKMPPDSLNEAEVYEYLRDSASESGFRGLAPSYISRAEYKGQTFIELEDLVTRFNVDEVNIMDLKLGTRTFLESEVQNSKPRADLFEKMLKLDPSSLTPEERARGWITKLRYMTFREELSSTKRLGFRIEGLRKQQQQSVGGGSGSPPPEEEEPTTTTESGDCDRPPLPHPPPPPINFHRLRDESEIRSLLVSFCSGYVDEYVSKLRAVRLVLEGSAFFRTHEMIGSSLLLIHDNEACGVWIIDFAKTIQLQDGASLTHRDKWTLGNHEDGVLNGIDNIIRLIS